MHNLRKLANELDVESTPSKDKEKINGGDALVNCDSEQINNEDQQDLPNGTDIITPIRKHEYNSVSSSSIYNSHINPNSISPALPKLQKT